jgi:prepilin-type N-terminal cleavage/methylation domain-containing protein
MKNDFGKIQSLLKGFTFVEIVIVMGIMVVLLMIGSVNFLPIKHTTSLSTTSQVLISDIKERQLKAMSGESSQGIYFDVDQKKYIVFKGSSFDPSNTTNFSIQLGDQIIVSEIDFTGRQIIFSASSGEISNFFADNKIVLLNTVTNEQRSIYFNKYGTIIRLE